MATLGKSRHAQRLSSNLLLTLTTTTRAQASRVRSCCRVAIVIVVCSTLTPSGPLLAPHTLLTHDPLAPHTLGQRIISSPPADSHKKLLSDPAVAAISPQITDTLSSKKPPSACSCCRAQVFNLPPGAGRRARPSSGRERVWQMQTC